MHLYTIMRGIKHKVDFTTKFMETTFLKWNTKDALTREGVEKDLQFSVRPIQLYELVFPEEELPKVMAMLDLNPGDKYGENLFKAPMRIIRKMLGLKEIPKRDDSKIKGAIPFIPRDGVGIHPVGIKADRKGNISGIIDAERV